MKHAKFLFILLPLLFTSCGEEWVLTNSGNCYIYTNQTDFIDWNGYVVSAGDFSVPLGKGIISTKEKDKIVHGEYIFNYTLSNDNYKQIYDSSSLKEYYFGEFSKYWTRQVPNGRGILYRQKYDDYTCYIGHFKNGAPDGFCLRYDNGKKVFEGEYKAGHANGYGKLYINEALAYEGNFINGKRNGEGTEYYPTYKLNGTWKEDKKDGFFSIERINNGTITQVAFSNDIADLSNGKVLYANGFYWEGPLSTNFEPDGKGILHHKDYSNVEERKNGKLTGTQELYFDNGAIYSGETKHNKADGYGTLVFANNIYYDGYWKNNKKNGYGELTFQDKWMYRGEFSNDTFNGEGIFETKSSYYSGNWKNGKKEGTGYLAFIKNDEEVFYDGEFKKDLFSGTGLLQLPDGSFYEGEWKDGNRNGKGKYQWANGDFYEGNWKENSPNGKGLINFADGNYYEGDFEQGVFNGNGIYHYSNGDRYEGCFINNKRDGLGIYYYNSGETYEGEFLNDTPAGKGKLYFTNDSYYEGIFENGKICGEGSLFIPTENEDNFDIIYSKNWNDKQLPSEVTIYFSNGDSFEGDFSNGIPGSGIWLTKEQRLNNRTTAQQLNDFYDLHKESINKILRVTQYTLATIDTIATITSHYSTGEIAVISGAIANLAGLLETSISIADMTVKTVDVIYDTNQIENAEKVNELWKEYEKDMIYDVSFVVVAGGLKAYREINRAQFLKEASKKYPLISSTEKNIANIGKTTTRTASYNAKDSLIRGIVKLNYGKQGSRLIKQYGDDAAKLLFKFGDHAVVPLQKSGTEVIQIYNTLGSQAMLPIFNYGQSAVTLISSNLNSGNQIARVINDFGNNGINYLNAAGENALRFANLYSKYDKDFIDVANRYGSNNIGKLCNIAETSGQKGLKILKTVPKSEFSRYSNYLNITGSSGADYIKTNANALPASINQQIIRDAAKNEDLRKVISGTYINNNTAVTMLKHSDRYADISKQLLKPNSCYRTGESNYYYLTDEKGRISQAIAIQLRSKNDFGRTARLPHNSESLGKLVKDDAGHLFGDQFGGSPQLDNIVSQSGVLNKGPYKNMEKFWADTIRDGKKFSATIKINYEGDSLRPSMFSVSDTIDGGHFYNFIN